jgi:hypothetical protein
LGRVLFYVFQCVLPGIGTLILWIIKRSIAQTPAKGLTFTTSLIALDYWLPRRDAKEVKLVAEAKKRVNEILVHAKNITLVQPPLSQDATGSATETAIGNPVPVKSASAPGETATVENESPVVESAAPKEETPPARDDPTPRWIPPAKDDHPEQPKSTEDGDPGPKKPTPAEEFASKIDAIRKRLENSKENMADILHILGEASKLVKDTPQQAIRDAIANCIISGDNEGALALLAITPECACDDQILPLIQKNKKLAVELVDLLLATTETKKLVDFMEKAVPPEAAMRSVLSRSCDGVALLDALTSTEYGKRMVQGATATDIVFLFLTENSPIAMKHARELAIEIVRERDSIEFVVSVLGQLDPQLREEFGDLLAKMDAGLAQQVTKAVHQHSTMDAGLAQQVTKAVHQHSTGELFSHGSGRTAVTDMGEFERILSPDGRNLSGRVFDTHDFGALDMGACVQMIGYLDASGAVIRAIMENPTEWGYRLIWQLLCSAQGGEEVELLLSMGDDASEWAARAILKELGAQREFDGVSEFLARASTYKMYASGVWQVILATSVKLYPGDAPGIAMLLCAVLTQRAPDAADMVTQILGTLASMDDGIGIVVAREIVSRVQNSISPGAFDSVMEAATKRYEAIDFVRMFIGVDNDRVIRALHGAYGDDALPVAAKYPSAELRNALCKFMDDMCRQGRMSPADLADICGHMTWEQNDIGLLLESSTVQREPWENDLLAAGKALPEDALKQAIQSNFDIGFSLRFLLWLVEETGNSGDLIDCFVPALSKPGSYDMRRAYLEEIKGTLPKAEFRELIEKLVMSETVAISILLPYLCDDAVSASEGGTG